MSRSALHSYLVVVLLPPYDSTELDDLHRAACIDALDVFLESESNIELINGYLTHR